MILEDDRATRVGWKDRLAGEMQSERRFLDYVVDGVSLQDRHGGDDVSCLGWFVPEEDELAAGRLLCEADPDVDGRVALWVCAECGDVSCGALTARIVQEGDVIVWKDFASSWFDYAADGWVHETGPFDGWNEIRFNAEQYRSAIVERPPSPAARPPHRMARWRQSIKLRRRL